MTETEINVRLRINVEEFERVFVGLNDAMRFSGQELREFSRRMSEVITAQLEH